MKQKPGPKTPAKRKRPFGATDTQTKIRLVLGGSQLECKVDVLAPKGRFRLAGVFGPGVWAQLPASCEAHNPLLAELLACEFPAQVAFV